MRRELLRLTPGSRSGLLRSLPPLFLVLAAFVLPALHPGPDADVFWHLRAGDDLLDGRAGAFRESWSYTADGTVWVNHEWLAEAVFSAARRVGGEAGLVLFTALIAALAALALWRVVAREGVPPWPAAFLIALGAAAMSDRFVPRPQILTYLCVAILFERLSAIRRGASPWTLIPLQVFWTNVHGPLWGLFFALPALFAGAAPGIPLRRRALVGAALLAASCVHPQGIRVLTDYAQALGADRLYHQTIREWLPLTDSKQEGIPQANATWALIVCGAAVLVAALASRDARRRPGLLLLLAAIVAAPFAAIRNRDLLAVGLVPLLALLWSDLRLRILSRRPAAVVSGLAALAAVAIPTAGLAFPGPGGRGYRPSWPPRLGLSTETFPAAATAFLAAHPVGTRIFDAYDYGGWLVDRLRDRKVFIDGRYFVYGEDLYLQYLLTRDGGPDALSVLDRTGTDLLVIRYPAADGYQGLLNVVLPRPEWALVFWDDDTLVLVRRSAAPAAWLEAHAYRVLFPNITEAMRDPGYWRQNFDALALEGRHAAAEAPGALLPRVLLGQIYEFNGRDAEAAEWYRKALALKPDHGPAQEGLARITARGTGG